MRTGWMSLAAVALAAMVSTAHAQKRERVVGSWIVTHEADPFDGKTKVVAVATTFGGSYAMAVRCLDNGVSVALFDRKATMKEGDVFEVRFRADQMPIVTTYGMALDDSMLEITEADEIVKQMASATQAAFRIENKRGVQNTAVFRMRSAKAAMGDVLKACSDTHQ